MSKFDIFKIQYSTYKKIDISNQNVNILNRNTNMV